MSIVPFVAQGLDTPPTPPCSLVLHYPLSNGRNEVTQFTIYYDCLTLKESINMVAFDLLIFFILVKHSTACHDKIDDVIMM